MLVFFYRPELKIWFAGIKSAAVAMPMSHLGTCCPGCCLTEEFIEIRVKIHTHLGRCWGKMESF